MSGVLLTLATTALALLAPAAQAGQIVDRIVAGDTETVVGFGDPPATANDTKGTGEGLLDSPRGIAFNDPTVADGGTDPQGESTNGYLYVLESANVFGVGTSRVQVFDAEGNFKFMFGRGVLTGGDGGEVCDETQIPCGDHEPEAGEEEGEFDAPYGIAIHQATGEVYVREARNRRVQQFAADGTFIRAWGWGVDDGSAEFQICEAPADVPCQAGIPGDDGGQFAGTFAHGPIAIDPSAPHHLFIGDPGNRRIQEFEPDGTFVRLFGWNVVADGQPGDLGDAFEICASTMLGACQEGEAIFGRSDPRSMAVDSNGTLYASSDSFSSEPILRFDTDAATPEALQLPLLAIDSNPAPPQGLIGGGGAAMTIDLATGNLLAHVVSGTGIIAIQELDTSVEPPVEVDRHVVSSVGPGGVSSNALAVDPATGDIHFSASSGATGHRVLAADTDGAPLAVMTIDDPSATVDDDKATFSGTVIPGGPPGFDTRYHFQYSRDGNTWSSTPERSLGDTGEAINVSEKVSGLEPNSLYRVRLVTRKSFANPEAMSGEVTFTSEAIPPTVQTAHPAARTATRAVLAGRVNPNNSPTTYRFEWGAAPGPPYPNAVPVPDGDAGDDFGSKAFVAEITGLEPETTYYYRLVADNGIEEGPGDTQIEGEERSFTTRAALPSLPGRGYELVSPADKVSGQGVGFWYKGPGNAADSGVAAYDAERFAVKGRHGNVLTDDGAFTFGVDWAFAERVNGEAGWVSHSPITHAAPAHQLYSTVHILSTTPDLSVGAWRSSSAIIKVFPEMADWDESQTGDYSLLADWTGRWELIAPTDLSQIRQQGDGAQVPHFSADGHHVAGTSGFGGLTGPGDPTHPDWPDLISGSKTVYIADISAGLSDSFDGNAVHSLAHVCTEGTEIPVVDAGTGTLETAACPPALPGRDARLISPRGATTTSSENVISEDGSRLFFHAPDPGASDVPGAACSGSGVNSVCAPQLYVRQRNPDGEILTRWISRAEDGLFGEQDASLTGSVVFEAATPDGSKVFFRTNAPLTADDPNGEGAPTPGGVTEGTPSNDSWDLYMYELPDDPAVDPAEGELTRISAGPDSEADCNSPLGGAGPITAHRFISDDGSQVYFACAGQLPGAGGAPDGGITAPAGSPETSDSANLYHYDATMPEDERWRFVARLPRHSGGGPVTDLSLGACATTAPRKGNSLGSVAGTDPNIGLETGGNSSCVRGSADGRFLTFWTQGRLTADDPDETSADIYAYDADADELVRITAPQGGVGGTYECVTGGGAAGLRCHGDPGFGASSSALPSLGVATEPDRDGDRIAFFQSRSRLVLEDEDDAYDVYQWRNGELSLLTTGQSETDGAFLKGNDVSGRNVYFVTRDQLTWQDFDSVLDIYTARLGGGIDEPPPPPACGILSGACEGAVSIAPKDEVPGTPVFQGPGNPTDRCNPRKLARNAKRASKRAKALRAKARRAQSKKRTRALHRRARKAARTARRTTKAAKRCRAARRQANAEGGSSR